MSDIYAKQIATQYKIPYEIMSSVVYVDDIRLPTAISATGANLREQFQRTNNWSEALYNYHYDHNKNAEAATEFTHSVLQAAGYESTVPGSGSTPSWFDKFMSKNPTPMEPNPDMQVSSPFGFGGTIEKYIGSAGIIVLGISIVVVALLMIPKVGDTVKTVVTKGVA